MAFKKHVLTSLVEVAPKEAAEKICAAYEQAKASQRDAAKLLGVAEATIIRWVKHLDLSDRFAKIKRRAIREGWHHENNRLATGRPRGWSKKGKAA